MPKPSSSPTPQPNDPASGNKPQRGEESEDTIIMRSGARTPVRKGGDAAAEILIRRLIDGLTDGVLAVDMSGKFFAFNRTAAAILGKLDVDMPLADRPVACGLFLPDQRTPFPAEDLPLSRALRGESTQDVPMFVRNASVPEGKWLQVRGSPVFDAQGRQIGAAAVFRDDTERKQQDQALEIERRFLRHLIQTQDRDRQLTAYDLHDGVVQLMTGALMRLEAYRTKPAGSDAAADEFEIAVDLLREAVDEARRMIGGLRPPEIDEKGVVGAIEYLASPGRHGRMVVDFIHDDPFERLSALQETTIFRIVQEALHNAERHSESPRARVVLRREGNTIHLEIRDWGKGFDAKTKRMRRFGLRGIEERSRLLGGAAQIESSPTLGTAIRVTLPLDAAPPQEVTETET